MNQRPIGRIPNDPDDGSFLCPNNILLGRALGTVPQGPFRETRNPRHRVEFIQKIIIFPLIVTRKKWKVERRNIRVDDIVVVQDSNAVRGNWITGRIVNVFPGKDGRIRNVKVKRLPPIMKVLLRRSQYYILRKDTEISNSKRYWDEEVSLSGGGGGGVDQQRDIHVESCVNRKWTLSS